MARRRSCLYGAFILLLISFQSTRIKGSDDDLPPQCREVAGTSAQKMGFFLNLMYLEADFYLRSSIGKGIEDVAPGLVRGPAPIGGRVANLDPVTRSIIEEFGYQAVGNIRAILNNTLVERIERPQLDISVRVFSGFINAAFRTNLSPPFNSYANTTNYVGTVYAITSMVQQYLVGIVPRLVNNDLQRVGVGILGSLSGRLGALRTLPYLRVNETVRPYQFTVANLSSNLAHLLNRLGNCGEKNEGLLETGADQSGSRSNVIAGDVNSLSFSRTEREELRIVFGTGNASMPGGIYPNGFNGVIATTIRQRGLI